MTNPLPVELVALISEHTHPNFGHPCFVPDGTPKKTPLEAKW